MRTEVKIKLALVIAVIALAFYSLLPTIKYYSMSTEDRLKKTEEKDPAFAELKTKILNLGLDLQGGMHLVVEIDVKKFLLRSAKKTDDILEKASLEAEKDDLTPVKTLRTYLNANNLSLVDYYGVLNNNQLNTDDLLEPLLTENLDKSVERALEIIRNRIDQFGVAEPTIQKLGQRRIVIEIAGDVNPDRIRNTIFKEARLEFSMLAELEDAEKIFTAANKFYRIKYNLDAKKDSTKTDITSTDATKKDETIKTEELFGSKTTKANLDSNKNSIEEVKYDETLFLQATQNSFLTVVVASKNKKIAEEIINSDDFEKYLRKETGNFKYLVRKINLKEGEAAPDYISVTAVQNRIQMTGEGIKDAKWALDPQGFNEYLVSMKFDDKSSRLFSQLSERYLNKQLAIILDNVIQSDPVFREKIPVGSNAQISNMKQEEAADLSIVLKTGSLPAPLKLIDELTVGASLGADSVSAGTSSTILALIIVLIFMILYYKKAGINANVAVILNIILMVSALAAFGGTLTLPGIAGIILTIGMAVDANVLIFERIREEIRAGSGVWSSFQAGFAKAMVAIIDSNLTTFIAGIVLYSYGSGSIRGFALTLMIGILTSLGTAVIMSKIMFETYIKENDTHMSV